MTDIDLDVPEELRSRLASAARRYGLSEHEFILKAITEKLDRVDGGADSAIWGQHEFPSAMTRATRELAFCGVTEAAAQ
jgi:hypothetical protein